jgi:2-polyprenyl-3-methyl-5-hydroxy-6-metoxy-1,4-benzoquinol methylase
LLGNSRWIARRLKSLNVDSIVELGAGDGHLSRKLSRIYPLARITGLDLVPPPNDWKQPHHWVQGDLLKTIGETTASICICSLVMHHFHRNELADLGRRLQSFATLIFSEPHRHCQPLLGSYLMQPFMGKVVRHDMPASIKAGFRVGELTELLRLKSSQWAIEESVTVRGSIRFFATKRSTP